MAVLAPASALLAPLLAFAATGILAAGEAAVLEKESGECASDMRVDLLQKSTRAVPIAHAVDDREYGPVSLSGAYNSSYITPLSLTKSTFAVSSDHVGKSLAFKRFFLPVLSEHELDGSEHDDFLQNVGKAVAEGAALPDSFEGSSARFDQVAWKETCGKGARVILQTVLGEEMDKETQTYGSGMSRFSPHGVYGPGNGSQGSSRREVGGLKVRDVERIFQEELGDLKEYSPWMDIHAGIYDNDLDSYARKFFDHGVPVLALRWPSAETERSMYSLIVHVPDTQEVFEIISASAPSNPGLVLREFPMSRHIFQLSELRLLMNSSGPTQLHISRSHYDLDAVKAHYKLFFKMEPIHEVRDADTGVSFVSFWHQTVLTDSVDVLRVQVMYWNRPDQSMAVGHTTEWLERRLEGLNSQYMRSYQSCWPIWGDNHYTAFAAPGDYFASVRQAYDDAGIGYMLFGIYDITFTGYFPLPGGMYLELQPSWTDSVPRPDGSADWLGDYCYDFTCAA